jgi:hypothetical protein
MTKELLFLIIFVIGEVIFNLTWFRYLKYFFKAQETTTEDNNTTPVDKKLLLLSLSVFKGVMERLIISIGLILGFAPILVVFGTIKLGTRFKDKIDITNDYFLIGNFSSILISLLYFYLFMRIVLSLGI